MQMPTAKIKSLTIKDFNGGYNPRQSPLLLSDGSQAPMQSPDLRNSDFSTPGGLSKRLGKAQQGNNVSGSSIYASQLNSNTTLSVGIDSGNSSYNAFAQKITTGAAVVISSISVKCSASSQPGRNGGTIRIDICSQSGGIPAGIVGISNAISFPNSATPVLTNFNFATPVSLNAGTVYYIVVVCLVGDISTSLNVSAQTGASANVSSNPAYNVDAWTNSANSDLYYAMYQTSNTFILQGIYDYRFGSGSITQNIMAVAGGGLYYKNGSNWTSIASGLGSGQNVLWDFTTAANYLFSCDYGNNMNQVWDGTATATMAHGYRLSPGYVAGGTPKAATISSTSASVLTMAANQPASGLYVGKVIWLTGGATAFSEQVVISSFATTGTAGTATYYVTSITCSVAPIQTDRTAAKWNGATLTASTSGGTITTAGALTTYKIIGITQLKSGGFRCSDEMSVDLAVGTTNQIQLTNIAMNSSTNGTQFAFDVPTGATVWYMTPAFNPTLPTTDAASGIAQLYYRLATTNVSTALNPMTNGTTSFNINSLPATTQNTPLIDTGYQQSFFTSQIDAPRAKFFVIFNNMIVSAGDPNGSSNLWFTPLGMPNVYGTAGGVLGANFPVPNFNDGQIIRGLYVWQGSLYIFKNQSIYRLLFTGQTGTSPFYLVRLMGEIGCLSHWSITESDQGMVFLSVQGPAMCYGSIVQLLPASKDIMNLFQATDPAPFNLASMIYSTGLLYEAKKQIWWGVSSTSATTRDLVLVYDYEHQIFHLFNSVNANYFGIIGDTNGFPQPWSGDYSGAVWRHDNGLDDGGSAIAWYFSTPWLQVGNPFDKKLLHWLYISGIQQSSGTLSVDLYLDFSASIAQTYTFDMTKAAFAFGGIENAVSINQQANYFRLVMRNAELDVPVEILAMRLDYESLAVGP